jgi:hypothetical protein
MKELGYKEIKPKCNIILRVYGKVLVGIGSWCLVKGIKYVSVWEVPSKKSKKQKKQFGYT